MNTVTYVEDAVFIQNDQIKTSSLKVAELLANNIKRLTKARIVRLFTRI